MSSLAIFSAICAFILASSSGVSFFAASAFCVACATRAFSSISWRCLSIWWYCMAWRQMTCDQPGSTSSASERTSSTSADTMFSAAW